VKILAIELSSAAAGVAVAAEGKITARRRFEAPRGRGAEVFSVLAEMRAAWHGADRVAVGIGPGSYNGLRVACALAGSWQMALGVELVAAPSCCLLDVAEAAYFAAGDARGGRIWSARVEQRELRGEIVLLTPDEFHLRVEAADLPVYRVGDLPGFASLPAAGPDAGVLALLAPRLTPVDSVRFGPIYLKPPHITAPRPVRP
jgi:tRNA threonylcarbamoyladenosine biosynthesis protein TsaB